MNQNEFSTNQIKKWRLFKRSCREAQLREDRRKLYNLLDYLKNDNNLQFLSRCSIEDCLSFNLPTSIVNFNFKIIKKYQKNLKYKVVLYPFVANHINEFEYFKKALSLCTHGFSETENYVLQDALKQNFGVNARVVWYKDRLKRHPHLYLPRREASKLRQFVDPQFLKLESVRRKFIDF